MSKPTGRKIQVGDISKIPVNSELNKIKKRNQLQKRDNLLSSWRQNRAELNDNFQKHLANDKIKKTGLNHSLMREFQSLQINIEDEDQERRCTVYNQGSVKKFDTISMKEMDVITQPTPSFISWSPVVKNNLFDHTEQQSNIPYFGDEVIDQNVSLIEGMEEEFNAGVEQEINDDKNLSDELFLDLVETLDEKYEVKAPVLQNESKKGFNKKDTPPILSPEKMSFEEESTKLPVPNFPRFVFEAISSQLFENHPAADNLKSRYEKLKPSDSGVIENIDEVDCSIVSSKASHSYISLLCRRCFMYDCDLHNDESRLEEPIPLIIPQTESSDKLPCGVDCVLNTDPNNTSFSNLYDKQLIDDINPLIGVPGIDPDLWTGPEETLFRVLIKTFPDNFCAISQAIITKSCRQVSKFSSEQRTPAIIRTKRKALKKKAKKGKNQHQLFKFFGERENTQAYIPCHHPDKSCKAEECSCRQTKNFCDKFCYCSLECKLRWPGCFCKGNCTTKHCPCFLASRECDPDLCKACNASVNFNRETSKCRNVVIQKRMGKRLFIGTSEVAGFGCFIGEDAAKNDFIAEYVGEMINLDEAEKRGLKYDLYKCSYMFKLNDRFLIDAARFGGKIRFANHSDKPNCIVKIVLVNGDHRIGIYADRLIQEGEELFFDYGNEFRGHGIKESVEG